MHVNPLTTLLQKIKLLEEELDGHRGFTMLFEKKIEKDKEKIRRRFEERVKGKLMEEARTCQQEQMQLPKVYHELLRDEMGKELDGSASASTSISSQVKIGEEMGLLLPVSPRGPCVNPFTTELQTIEMIKEELNRQHGFAMQLKKKMEEDMERIRRRFEEKVKEKLKEEAGWCQQKQVQLVDTNDKLLRHKLKELFVKLIEDTGLSASASASTPIPPPTASATVSTPIPPSTASATAMGIAPQTGPHIPSATSHPPSVAPSAFFGWWYRTPNGVVLLQPRPALGVVPLAPAPYQSQPHLSEFLATSNSSQMFAPSAGNLLQHPSLSALGFSGPHLSFVPARRPGLAPGPALQAPEQHLPSSQTHLSVSAATSTPGVVLQVPAPQLGCPQPNLSTIPGISTPAYGPARAQDGNRCSCSKTNPESGS